MTYREMIKIQYNSGDLRAAYKKIKTMASLNQSANETKQWTGEAT